MAGEVKLIGPPEKTWLNTMPANVFMLFKMNAEESGIAGTIRFLTIAPGTGSVIRLAAYSDQAGEPGTLLAQTTEASPVAGWNSVPISFTVIKNQTYWLAFIGGVARPDIRHLPLTSGMQRRYKTVAYDGFAFPDPAGAGYTATDGTGAVEIWSATGGAGRLIGVGDPGLITVGHPKLISAGLSPSLIRGP